MKPSHRVAALAVAVLAAATGACASAGPGPLVPGPNRAEVALGPVEVAELGEILMLEDHRRYDPAAFQRLYGSRTIEVRRRVVTAAGRVGDPAAVPFIVRALGSDPSPAVRADAAFALGELGDTSEVVMAALDEATPSYWVPVRDEEVAIVVEALGALGKLATPAARRMVADALLETSPAVQERTRRVAAEALLASWRFGEATPVHRIAAFLDSGDPEIRWRAAYALSRSGHEDGVPYLLGRVHDPEHRVRAYAVRGLASTPARAAGVRDSAVVLLTTALRDDHPHVRINALGALGSHAAAAPIPSIAALLRDPDPNVAIAAAAALARLGRAAAEPLSLVLRDEAVPLPVRGAALANLAAVDPAAALPLVLEWSAADPAARWHAARAVASLGWEDGGPILRRLARYEDPRVAVAALEAAGTLAADTTLSMTARRQIESELVAALGTADLRVATVAAAALAPLAPPAAVDPLLALYDRAGSSDTESGRAAALTVVETLGAIRAATGAAGTASSNEAADRFFAGFPRPLNRWVHRAAADTLGGGWGPAPSAVASEERAFYEEMARRYVAEWLTEDEEGPVAVVRTASGTFQLRLLATEAPLTVANFVELARSGYFDGGVWHRVVPNFVLQDGAPAGYASGGPGRAIRDEINRVRYERGVLGMALSGPDTGGSQWFITHSPQPHLDGGYTVFGRVTDGLDVMDQVVQGEPIQAIEIRW